MGRSNALVASQRVLPPSGPCRCDGRTPDNRKAAAGAQIAGAQVTLPAGSVDALAAAIAAAGNNGTVIVESGMHVESAQVVINSRVSIVGEPGAVLQVATTPDPNGVSSEAV